MTTLFTAYHFEVLKWFQMKYPKMVRAMKDSSHHFDSENINPYHGEDDVWTHTMMAYKNSEFFSNGNHRVKWSALLHDIGKPAAREEVPERKRVRFIGHEGISAYMAIDVLNAAEVPVADAVEIFRMIACHDKLFAYLKPDNTINETEVKKVFAGENEFLRDLVHQVRCDSLGRFHNEGEGFLDFVRNLPDLAKGVIDEIFQARFVPLEKITEVMQKPTMTLLIGPPNCGKSTWLKENVKEGTVVLSRDDLVVAGGERRGLNYNEAFKYFNAHKEEAKTEVDGLLTKQAVDARKNGQNVVVDMTNMTKKGRTRWLNEFSSYQKKAVLFMTGMEVLKQRNTQRAAETGKFIPPFVLTQMCKNFTLPLYSEGFDHIQPVWFREE